MTRRFRRILTHAFPPVPGNGVRWIDHGPGFYERMIDAIDGARSYVDVEMYLWDDDAIGRRFVGALAAAAQRGLRVRVLIDASGASEAEAPLGAVVAAGGDVRLFNPFRVDVLSHYVHRTHKKILVTDGCRAFCGGAGFSQHWSGGKRDERPWHDRMFEFTGPVVAQFDEVFEAGFTRWDPTGPARPDVAADKLCGIVPPADGDTTARVLRGFPDARDFRTLVLDAVRGAKDRVWIGTPYFLPPFTLRRALGAAARRGVDVQVVHPSQNHAHPVLWWAARGRYGRWLRRGVAIHEYQPSFYHAKLAVVDRTLAIVGSSNLDAWSWLRNAEFDVAITDAPTVDRIAACFEEDRARSRAVTKDEASIRGGLSLLKQRMALWIEHWL
ncbi:MAG: putative cardiolipin synthase YwiE [Planctomycetes bacterium]|nr:putative cardiolipin synthase YwiE [Planctomycetota bacterium]